MRCNPFLINLNFLSVVEAGKSSVGAVEFAWRVISLASNKNISSQVGAKKDVETDIIPDSRHTGYNHGGQGSIPRDRGTFPSGCKSHKFRLEVALVWSHSPQLVAAEVEI